jgi:Spy/CpxP family protein refolding chaperone
MSLGRLELTEDQQSKLKALVEADRQAQSGTPADGQLRRELHTAIYADSPDAATIADLQQRVAAALAARHARQVALEQQIAQILTPEQRAQVRERAGRGPRAGAGRGLRGARP